MAIPGTTEQPADLATVVDRKVTAAEARMAIEAVADRVPTLVTGLNCGQYRAIRRAYTRDSEALIPRCTVVTPANGWGKTQLLVQDMVGWTKGSAYLKSANIARLLERVGLDEQYHGLAFPQEALDYYDGMKVLRDAGKLSLRLVCDAEDTKEGGSLHKTIREWIPDAVFSAQDNAKCYRQVEIPHPDMPGLKNVIAIKTFDQEPRKHSGSNCHRIWVNEPMPQLIWGETAARTRSKKGEQVGSILLCATVLNQAPYISDVIESPRNAHIQGAIWENCAGEEVTDEDAAECLEKTGIELEKTPDGQGYLTHGFLSRQSILDMIQDWKSGSPDELEARKFGLFMHLSGRVFKQFNHDVHVVPDALWETIPRDYPILHVVDPHPRKPDFSAWILVAPGNRLVYLHEHPGYPLLYENLKTRDLTIDQTCEAWRRVEAELGITHQVVARLADPNMMLTPNSRDNRTLQYLYAMHGFNFDVNINDSVDLGYRELNRLLYYDRSRCSIDKHDPSSIPLLIFLDRCQNGWRSFLKHGYKEKRDPNASVSEQVEDKYSHGIAVCRYAAMWLQGRSFEGLKIDRNRLSDYEKIKISRLPPRAASTNPWKKQFAGRALVMSRR
jgi:hypothetical protein